jgi:hypothetical protein
MRRRRGPDLTALSSEWKLQHRLECAGLRAAVSFILGIASNIILLVIVEFCEIGGFVSERTGTHL